MFGWGGGRVRRHGGGRRGFSLTSGIGYGNAGNVPEYSVRGGGIPIDVMAITNRWQVVDALPTGADSRPLTFDGGAFAPGQYEPSGPVVLGQAGYWNFVACTIIATTRGGDRRPYALTAMQFPGVLPYVHIYPESWRASATSLSPEVHLESGEFNDKYSVFSDSARTVYQLISPRSMRYLIGQPPLDELWTAGQSLCICRVDPHNAAVLGAHLSTLTTLAGDIPSSAWDPA